MKIIDIFQGVRQKDVASYRKKKKIKLYVY